MNLSTSFDFVAAISLKHQPRLQAHMAVSLDGPISNLTDGRSWRADNDFQMQILALANLIGLPTPRE